MRSDREEMPEGFTKEQADRAEIAEANDLKKRSLQRGMSALAAPTDCMRYWPQEQYLVCGEIRVKYDSLGGSTSFLGPPSSNDVANPDNYGRRQTFWNGPIYWSPATGAHPVVNSFLNRWGTYQYEAGRLKYPTTDEIVLPDGGRRQEFQQGAIYVAFQNAIGAAIFNGPLRDKYNSVGGLAPANTLLGYPTQDQVGLPDGQGQMDRFQNGVIYWSPNGGAHPVTGGLLTKWAYSAYEIGSWGYPIGDATVSGANSSQPFEFGVMTWPQQNIADAAVVDDGDIAPYVDGQNPTTAAAYVADSKEGVFADAIMIAGGTGATSSNTPIDDAELEEPTLGDPEGNTDEIIDPTCFDRAKVPANNKWYYGRKFACLVSTEPMSVGYGTSFGTMIVTITTGVRSSHKTGSFIQEYQIEYGAVTGNIGTPVIKYKVTGSGFTDANHRYGGPEKREPVFSGQKDKIQLWVDQRSMSDLAVQTRSTKLVVSFGNNTPGYKETNTREFSMTTLRCDNTIRGAGGYRQGCVYPAKTPGWNMDPDLYTQAVGHVQNALAAGLPGGVLKPLHREADVKLRSDNRNKACPTRGAISDGRRNGITGRSCDEYPFASTKEGAAYTSGGPRTNNPACHIPDVTTPGTGYSVCMINAQQNNLAGSFLGAFYGFNRVINADAFYVRAAGGTLP
jgi:hypothetical protein